MTSVAHDGEHDIEYEVGSGNVFADLGFDDPDLELAKAEVCRQIAREIQERRLTQQRAAQILGIDQPRVSLILRGQTEDFSLERLLELVQRLGFAVDIRLSKAADPQAQHLRVTVPA